MIWKNEEKSKIRH